MDKGIKGKRGQEDRIGQNGEASGARLELRGMQRCNSPRKRRPAPIRIPQHHKMTISIFPKMTYANSPTASSEENCRQDEDATVKTSLHDSVAMRNS